MKTFMVAMTCLMLTIDAVRANDIQHAIKAYQNQIQENEETMKWFIPLWSFSKPKLTNALYGCSGWQGCGACEPMTKILFAPLFYVACPAIHLCAEVTATVTARLVGLPYLCYLAHRNNQHHEVITLLTEATSYQIYKSRDDEEGKRSFYLNSTKLRPALVEVRSQLRPAEALSVTDFIAHVVRNLSTDQYRLNDRFWSIDDFINAAVMVENNEDSFSQNETVTLDPEKDICIICQTRSVSGVFVPCGHFIVCGACYDLLQARAKDNKPICPICRKEVTSLQGIYRSNAATKT